MTSTQAGGGASMATAAALCCWSRLRRLYRLVVAWAKWSAWAHARHARLAVLRTLEPNQLALCCWRAPCLPACP